MLADAALLDLDRYATGAGLLYSRVGTALMLTAPNEQRLADAIDTVARVQQDTTGHRRCTGDPLYPGPQSFARLTHASSPHVKRNASVRPSRQMRHTSVSMSPTFTGQVREVFHQATPTQGQCLAVHLIQRLPACPIPEIARLGRTLRKWKDALDDYFDTGGASNGPTEAINGHYRARQTHRQRLPQPHQLPTPNAPHRMRPRCLHPHPTLKSP